MEVEAVPSAIGKPIWPGVGSAVNRAVPSAVGGPSCTKCTEKDGKGFSLSQGSHSSAPGDKPILQISPCCRETIAAEVEHKELFSFLPALGKPSVYRHP